MKCKVCGYRLWQLPARRCPECGAEFRPSDYEFTPNSVEFCCPHCGQPYYGTGPMGHIVPTMFDCVSCGRHVTMDEMILRPAPGVDEDQTQILHLPWMERRKRGWLRGWLGTVRMALLSPARMMRDVPPDSSGWEAYGFAFLNTLVPMLVAALPVTAMMVIMTLSMSTSGVPRFIPFVLIIEFAVIGIIYLVGAAVWALVTHLLLRLTGGTAGPLLRTQQAIYYSSGANTITAIPCFGPYVGWIWWIVSAVFAVKEGQRVHGGRAALAVLGLPIGVGILFVGFFMAIVTVAGPTAARFSAASTASSPMLGFVGTQNVTRAIVDYARQHNGRGPEHAAQLITQGSLFASDFASDDSTTSLGRIPLAGTTLEYFNFAKPREQARLAKKAVADLPKGAVAHRLGDYVFIREGKNPCSADNRLWVVVWSPDTATNAAQPPASSVTYGMSDGVTSTIPAGQFLSELKKQNDVRAEYGLPPLPDLRKVTYTQPAAASGPAEAPE